MTREEHIYFWKIEGGSMSWARWATLNEIPVKNPRFIEEAVQAAKGIKIRKPGRPGIVLRGKVGS